MFIHFFCLCPLGLATKLNFNISKEAYWDRIVDSIGDGVRVEFPIKVILFLSWSPKNHTLQGNSVVPLPRYRPEKISISFCKAPCSVN